jgi:transcriptional regulator with XRE-family HTH domain
MTPMEQLGEKFRILRSIKGLSQENIAQMLGISLTAYAKIEQGKTDINYSRLVQIAEKLEIPLKSLVSLGEGNIYVMNDFSNINSVVLGNKDAELEAKIRENMMLIESLQKEVAYLKKINELLEQGK